MSDPDIDSITREARRKRRLPPASTCGVCGGAEHLRLLRDGRVLCYADRRAEGGAGPTEVDHVAGRHNVGGLTVELLANDHRTVTDIRLRVGLDRLPPPAGDPLLMLAHVLGGVATLLLLAVDWLVSHAATLAASGAQLSSSHRPFPVVP